MFDILLPVKGQLPFFSKLVCQTVKLSKICFFVPSLVLVHTYDRSQLKEEKNSVDLHGVKTQI